MRTFAWICFAGSIGFFLGRVDFGRPNRPPSPPLTTAELHSTESFSTNLIQTSATDVLNDSQSIEETDRPATLPPDEIEPANSSTSQNVDFISGIGLVVGLNGTGAHCASTREMAIDRLSKLEFVSELERDAIMDQPFVTRSLSHVFVTARPPSSACKGTTLEVTVSVLDDANSLEGGTLLATELRGKDGTVYATAHGRLTNAVRATDDLKEQPSNATVARLIDGAIVVRESGPGIDTP